MALGTITARPGYSYAKAPTNPPSRIHHVVGKNTMSIAQETQGDHSIPQGRGEGTYKKQPHFVAHYTQKKCQLDAWKLIILGKLRSTVGQSPTKNPKKKAVELSPRWQLKVEVNKMLWKTSWWFFTNPFEKYARQNGNLNQIGMKINNVWNHHLEFKCFAFKRLEKQIWVDPKPTWKRNPGFFGRPLSLSKKKLLEVPCYIAQTLGPHKASI